MATGEGQPIGKARVEITADLTPLNQGVDAAKAKVEELASATEDAGKTAQQAWDEMVDGAVRASDAVKDVGKSTESVGDAFSQNAILIAGAIASIASAVSQIKEYIDAINQDGTTAAGEFLDSIQGRAVESRISSTRKELAKLNNDLDQLRSHWLNVTPGVQLAGWGTGSISAIREKISQLNKQLEADSVQATKNKDEKEKASADRRRAHDARVIRESLDAVAAHDREEREKKQKSLLHDFAVIREAQEATSEHFRKQAEAMDRASQNYLKNILDAEKSMERIYQMQSRGFDATDAGGSFAAQMSALEAAIRNVARQSNGANA